MRVAAVLPNCAQAVVAFLASERIGAIWVGVSPALTASEIIRLLADVMPHMLLLDPAMSPEVGIRQ
jgi:acyl-coenzyme A synthetase/AMP-(fatty) acid ligase